MLSTSTKEKFSGVKLKKKFSNLRYYLGFMAGILSKVSLLLTLTLLFLSLIGGLTMMVELWAMTRFIDEIASYSAFTSQYLGTMLHFLPFIGAFIGAMLLQHYTSSIRPYIAEKLNERSTRYLKNKLYEKSMSLRLEAFEKEEYYNRLELSRRLMNRRLVRALTDATDWLSAFIQWLIIVYAVSRIGWVYALLLVLCFIPIIIYKIRSNRRFIEVNYGQSPVRRKQAYWRNLASSRDAAAELRLFQLGPFVLQNWKKYTKQLIHELLAMRKRMAILDFKGQSAYLVLLFVMMGATVFAGLRGAVSIGVVVATLYLLDRLERITIQLTYTIDECMRFYYEFKALPEYLDLDEEESGPKEMSPVPFQESIQFENVSFTYPGQKLPAISQLNVQIRAGERIVLAGENGAGKSTFCMLLLGLYQPTEGRILIDGTDLKQIDPAAWRKRAATVFQNFMRYQLSAQDNIAFGNVRERLDLGKVKQAAMRSGIHPVIEQLPKQYQTLLGKHYEGSFDLSGGEWQKTAISRAYFREAELLILDEPASALDAHAEYELYKEFSEMTQGKTSVMVSHRLGSAQLADRVLFLDRGMLIEQGSHSDLLEANEAYAYLYRIQAKWYEETETSIEEGGEHDAG